MLTRYHPRSGKYRVLFDDGDEQDTDMPHPEVKTLRCNIKIEIRILFRYLSTMRITKEIREYPLNG